MFLVVFTDMPVLLSGPLKMGSQVSGLNFSAPGALYISHVQRLAEKIGRITQFLKLLASRSDIFQHCFSCSMQSSLSAQGGVPAEQLPLPAAVSAPLQKTPSSHEFLIVVVAVPIIVVVLPLGIVVVTPLGIVVVAPPGIVVVDIVLSKGKTPYQNPGKRLNPKDCTGSSPAIGLHAVAGRTQCAAAAREHRAVDAVARALHGRKDRHGNAGYNQHASCKIILTAFFHKVSSF
jgi:hypothetical protein